MRLAFTCLLLVIAPGALMFGWKEFGRVRARAQHEAAIQPKWHHRGEVLFFNASWCGPCRKMKPLVAKLRAEGYHVRDIDVDSHRELAAKYRVRGIPTFVLLTDGEESKRLSGGTSPENLRQFCAAAAP